MTKVKLSEPFESMSGGYNKKYFVSTRGSKTILTRRRDISNLEPTEKQMAQQEFFADAAKYGAGVKNDPAKWAWYKSLQDRDHSAFNMAVADFLSLPVIHDIDASSYTGHADEIIPVTAYDKFRVVSVTVNIHAADGTLVEQGLAERRERTSIWYYITRQDNPTLAGTVITAVVTDVPGHQVELSKTL
jgi:hypothetical protein